MEILNAYSSFFESKITGRYLTSDRVFSILETYGDTQKISEIGTSVNGVSIKMVTLGQGKKKVLAWSQMHGNESTTTKAVIDLIKFLTQESRFQSQIETFLKTHTLYIIPILNPDGAKAYTRENANGVDLNRDAQLLSQPESKVLASVCKQLQPDLCLNLHDQRTIYGFETGKCATVSFLSPAADPSRQITASRKSAMLDIANMAAVLQNYIPGHIGRYDDAFNENCVGDAFQMAGVPTILFEAGHAPTDYQREETRKYICFSLLALLGFVPRSGAELEAYFNLPENKKNFLDIIVRNATTGRRKKRTEIGIQYAEVLVDGRIKFVPRIEKIGDLSKYYAHKELMAQDAEILVNSQEKCHVGEKVATIINKKDNSVLYINED